MDGSRGRLGLGAAVAIAVGIATAVWVAGDDRGPRELDVPPAGEVAAAFVERHPVFVVHADAGEVLVLDAVSPHDPVPKVLAFCRTSGWFEDLWHGSKFDRRGWWTGGPAPTGMARYAIVRQDGHTVTVGDRGEPPTREAGMDRQREEPVGPACTDGAEPDDLVVHDPMDAGVDGARTDLRYPSASLTELDDAG